MPLTDGQYSLRHVAAYRRWHDSGFKSQQLSEADVRAIEEEDADAGAHIRRDRATAAPAPSPVRALKTASAQPARKIASPSSRPRDWAEYAKTHGSDSATVGMVDVSLRETLKLSTSIGAAIERLSSAERRIAELESAQSAGAERVKALEARPTGLAYRGVWKAGETYLKHEGVTWDGSVWIALQETRMKPGETGTGARPWQLAVKRGTPGRDTP